MRAVAAVAAVARPNAKLQRWTDLIAALLARRRGATFDQLARDVPEYAEALRTQSLDNVKRGLFERDKAELREFGVRIDTLDPDDDGETKYALPARDFYLPYLAAVSSQPEGYRALPAVHLTPDDLALLGESVARLEQLGDPVLTENVRSAASKLAFDLPFYDSVATDLRVLDASAADPRTFELLSDALRRRKLVTFEYRKPDSDSVTERRVEPFGLFFVNAHWYLAARDRTRDDVRNFRLTRMSKVKVEKKTTTTLDYIVPASFNLRAHAQSRDAWELGTGDVTSVDVRWPSGFIQYFDVRRTDAFVRWLLSLAGDARPTAPPSVVDAYRAMLRDTLAVYQR